MTVTDNGHLHRLLDRAERARDGGTYPIELFGDPDVYRAEQEQLFPHSWLFVGHVSEIREKGDYVTRPMGEDEVIVTRAEDGSIHVLLNACRHRAAPVCRGDKGNTSHFRCPFHGWTYRNDGTWASAPRRRFAYKTLDVADWGLIRAKVEVRYGLIFATMDPEAPPLVEYLGDMDWHLEAFFDLDSRGMVVMGEPERAVMEANWKTAAENYCGDALHVAVLHKSIEEIGIASKLHSQQERYNMFDVGNGHGAFGWNLETSGLPVEAPFGYPKRIWDLFDQSDLTADQQRYNAEIMPLAGTVFPNFGFFRGFAVDPVTFEMKIFTQLRLWSPLAADRTEVWSWMVQYEVEPADYRTEAYIGSHLIVNSGSILEQDDFTAWNGPSRVGARAFQRVAGMELNYMLGMPGMSGGEETPFPGAPGIRYVTGFSEGNIRSFQKHYLDRMRDHLEASR